MAEVDNELSKSKVQQRLAYGAGAVAGFFAVYAMVTHDRDVIGWATGLISGVIGFWVGKRST